MTEPLLLAFALVAYNNLLNRWKLFNGWLYLPLNVAAGSALLAVARFELHLDGSALGLSLRGIGLGVGIAAAGLCAFLPLVSRRGRTLLADERLTGASGLRGAYIVLVRIPVGTALFEEIAFRGVLFAAWQRPVGTVAAAVGSAAAFGLWHVAPTLNLVRANRPGAGRRAVWAVLAGGVVLTAAAGLFLAWLRVHAGGIAAPLAVHASFNSASAAAALMAHRLQA